MSLIVIILLSTFLYKKITININKKNLFPLFIIASISGWMFYKLDSSKVWSKFSALGALYYKSPNAVSGEIDKLIEKVGTNKKFNPINIKYQSTSKLHAIAKGMNLIVVIMESVRADNLFLYGYKRHTMPFLESLRDNMIISDNTYVTQDRSCKTMGSLMLGIYPDPRYGCLTWDYRKLKSNDSFLKRLLDNNYSLYFSTTQHKGAGDNFVPFLKKITNNKITIESIENFKQRSFAAYDEKILSANLFEWIKKQKTPFAAFMWTQAAHMPYYSNYKPFKENNEIDKYDNAIYDIDMMIKDLVTKLKQKGILSNTMFLFFGDHGEAVGKNLDFGHGKTLNDYTIHIPFLIYQPSIIKKEIHNNAMIQTKDIASTTLDMLGIDNNLRQSENMFLKSRRDKIYLSNVYQTYKLGYTTKDITATYLVEKNRLFFNKGYIDGSTLAQKKELLSWYKYQTLYIDKKLKK